MKSAQDILSLVVVPGPSCVASEREAMTYGLLSELRDIVRDLELRGTSSSPVEGAKGLSEGVQQIVLATLASGGVVTALVAAVQNWLLRNTAAEVEVQIGEIRVRLKGGSENERREVLSILQRALDSTGNR